MNTKQLDSIADVIAAVVAQSVAPILDRLKALEDMPTASAVPGEPGKNGRDGNDGKEGLAGKDGTDGVDGEAGPAGEPGKDGKSFTIEEADSLLSEKMARWELDFERRATSKLDEAVSKMRVPQDGRDGRDGVNGQAGKDGLDGMDAFQLEEAAFELQEDGRTLKFLFQREGRDWRYTHSVKLPHMIYRGIFSEGVQYDKGDCVTFGGSLWHAKSDTSTAKPGADESAWTLAVKKGRDGRDGRDGIDKTARVILGV